MWTEKAKKYVEPETVKGFPHGKFELFEGQVNEIFFYPQGGYPQKSYRPDRENSILKVIEIADFAIVDIANGYDERRFLSTYTARFLGHLEEALEKRGGTGISERFDLNYIATVHIVPTGETRYGEDAYKVYVEVDYPRDMGSWVSQISTKAEFSAAVKAAATKTREDSGSDIQPKIVHIGMTGRFEN